MSTRWRVILIVSLALNLFLAGALAVRLAWRWSEDRSAHRFATNRGSGLDALAPDRRQAFLDVVGRASRENNALYREMRAARAEAGRRFTATPYDPLAVAAQLDEANALELRLRRQIEQPIIGYAATISAEERQVLRPVIERGLRRTLRLERQERERREAEAPADATPPRP